MSSKFTPEVAEVILQSLKSGCFMHVAAARAGIALGTFRHWLNNPKPEYQAFRQAVDQAMAEARAWAEQRIFDTNPAMWLRYGPGRERIDMEGNLLEGWTEAVQPKPNNTSDKTEIVVSPNMTKVLELIQEICGDDAEKKALVAEKIKKLGME